MGQKSEPGLHGRLAVDELSILNHELGNVLHGLSGMAGLLRDSGLTAEQVRWLEAIEQSSRQIHRIMESTLVYRDGEEPGVRVSQKRFNGVDLLEDVMVSHAPAALSKGLELVLVPDPALPSTWRSDCGLLRQLLDNLVGNAIKFTPSGSVVLRATVGEGGDLLLSVCDSGPGISQPDTLFEPWIRGAAAEKGTPGSGLGLYVCRRIVESMSGSLTAVPGEQAGTRFDVLIPAVLEAGGCESTRINSLNGLNCLLNLEQPLLDSVRNFLSRLGIGWRIAWEHHESSMDFDYEIALAGNARHGTAGLRIFRRMPAAVIQNAYVNAPVLESALEKALFQLELEQRFSEPGAAGAPPDPVG